MWLIKRKNARERNYSSLQNGTSFLWTYYLFYQLSLCEFLSVVLHQILSKWCRATQGHSTLIVMCHLIILWFRSQRTHLRESLPHLPAQIDRIIFRIRTFSPPPQTDGSINLSLSPLDLCCQHYQGGRGWGGRLSWGFCQSAKSLCNTVANPSIRSAKSTLSQQPFTSPVRPVLCLIWCQKIIVQI